jgi:hypothetical protein
MMLIIIYIRSYVFSFSNDQKNRYLQENLILQVENIFSIQKQFIDSKNNSHNKKRILQEDLEE